MLAFIALFFPAAIMVVWKRRLFKEDYDWKAMLMEYIVGVVLINFLTIAIAYLFFGSEKGVVSNINAYNGFALKYLALATIFAFICPLFLSVLKNKIPSITHACSRNTIENEPDCLERDSDGNFNHKDNWALFTLSLIFAICSVAAINIDYEISSGTYVLQKIFASMNSWGISNSLLVIVLVCIYIHVANKYTFSKSNALFSGLLAILMLLGLCYENETGLKLVYSGGTQILKTFIILTGYGAIFYCGITYLEYGIKLLMMRLRKNTWSRIDFQNKKILAISGLIIFLCWLPYVIGLYPGTVLYDSVTMLKQFFGYATLSNHHPYFLTWIYGSFATIGSILGSASFGLFMLIMLQLCFFISAFLYAASLFDRMGVNKIIIITMLICYAIIPVFPLYCLTLGKNVSYTAVILFILLFLIELIFVKKKNSQALNDSADEFQENPSVRGRSSHLVGKYCKLVFFALCCVLAGLTRNEGIFVVIAIFICVLIISKGYRKQCCAVFIPSICIIILWTQCLLPVLGVAQGSVAESLSIPLMQTARTVYYHGDEMSQDEIDVINQIIDFDSIKDNYNPEISDSIKSTYNNNASDEEISAYIKVYIKQFFEYPIVYIDAVLNKSYGYLYPDCVGREKSWIFFGWDQDTSQFKEDGYDFSSAFPNFVKKLKNIFSGYRQIPLLGSTSSIGFYTWCTLISAFLICKKRNKMFLVSFVPALMTLLICIASPVNAYFRYGLPIVFGTPIMILLALYCNSGIESYE